MCEVYVTLHNVNTRVYFFQDQHSEEGQEPTSIANKECDMYKTKLINFYFVQASNKSIE